jgi:hypothetical protein
MEYTFALHAYGHAIGVDTVIASSEMDALNKMAKLDYHYTAKVQAGETIELHLVSSKPVASFLGVPKACQVCRVRPTRRAISTPWDPEHPFLFTCDTPENPRELHCMQTYIKENDCKKFDIPPATMEFTLTNWIVQTQM